MDNIRGSHIRGQLARPKQGEKLPAMLIVQWAGVYPLQKSWVTERAAEGWLTLNLNAHDLPIDETEQFYRDQASGPLNDYPAIGNDDRETSYFDVVNFASRATAPVLVGVGLIDTTCPSPGVFAACNQLRGPKEIVILPIGEHGEKNGSHRPYYARFQAWDQALLTGNPAPVQ